MAKRKLTDKLKAFLYANRWKVKQSDYEGDALAYLKRLRAASKAAKKRKAATATIGKTAIPRNSELYETIAESARLKKTTVAKFVKKYKKEIDALLKDRKIVLQRETSYAIDDIRRLPKKSKVFINGEQVTKGDAIHALQSFTGSAMRHTDTVIINYEMTYDLNGNLNLTLPTDKEIEEAEELAENGEDEAYYSLLEDATGLLPVQS